MRRGHEFQGGSGLGDLPLDLETGHRAVNPVLARPGQSRQPARPDVGRGQPAPARRRVSFMPWNFATIVGSKQYLNANEMRSYLLVQNNSAADIWMGFGTNAGLGVGVKIVAGGSGEWYASMFGRDAYGPTDSLYFWAAAGGGLFTVLEG